MSVCLSLCSSVNHSSHFLTDWFPVLEIPISHLLLFLKLPAPLSCSSLSVGDCFLSHQETSDQNITLFSHQPAYPILQPFITMKVPFPIFSRKVFYLLTKFHLFSLSQELHCRNFFPVSHHCMIPCLSAKMPCNINNSCKQTNGKEPSLASMPLWRPPYLPFFRASLDVSTVSAPILVTILTGLLFCYSTETMPVWANVLSNLRICSQSKSCSARHQCLMQLITSTYLKLFISLGLRTPYYFNIAIFFSVSLTRFAFGPYMCFK